RHAARAAGVAGGRARRGERGLQHDDGARERRAAPRVDGDLRQSCRGGYLLKQGRRVRDAAPTLLLQPGSSPRATAEPAPRIREFAVTWATGREKSTDGWF